MCIRDRFDDQAPPESLRTEQFKQGPDDLPVSLLWYPSHKICLLYTSDAADERSSVDLGGRRIIKKKKQKKIQRQTLT